MKISFANRIYIAVCTILTIISIIWLNSYTEDTPSNFFYISTSLLAMLWLITLLFIIYIQLLINWDDITDWLNNLDK